MSYIIKEDTKDGLSYVETSQYWKEFCSPLPCFAELWWPDYLTKVIKTSIDGNPVIIQLWKGWCQRFGGRWGNFPGGMGAEVGIYHKVDDDDSQLALFRKPVTKIDQGLHQFRDKLSHVSQKIPPVRQVTPFLPRHDRPHGNPDGEVWYPIIKNFPWLSFRLVNPYTGEEFFRTTSEKTYWLTRWMTPDSYRNKYQKEHWTPPFAANYVLHYSINGKSYPPW
jgi:hypothetical protein